MAPNDRTRSKIVDALMALLAERRLSGIALADIAERAEVPLATLREAYDTRLDILTDFSRRIDRAVLAGTEEGTEENARDRLFEVLMRRLEALEPHRAALSNLARQARTDPGLALVLNRIACISQGWMLAAANIRAAGPRGAVRIQGLVLVWSRVMAVWLEDDDPGLGATMAALDRELRRGEEALVGLQRLGSAVCAPLRFLCGPRRTRRRPRDEAAEMVV